jgi:hypothetical protein
LKKKKKTIHKENFIIEVFKMFSIPVNSSQFKAAGGKRRLFFSNLSDQSAESVFKSAASAAASCPRHLFLQAKFNQESDRLASHGKLQVSDRRNTDGA